MLSILKKINFLITKRQRKGLVILAFLLFIGMIFEVFGLGILIPAISILLDPDLIEKTPILNSFRIQFSEFSDQFFLSLVLSVIVFIYFFKSLFLILITHKQNRFLSNITTYISNRLFESYLNQEYSFHLKRNTSELIKNIQVEIYYLHAYLLSLITFIIEGGLVIAVLSTLIYIEPFGALSIGVFYGFLSLIFLQFTKRKLKIWGDLRQELDADVSKIALEGLGGVKDLIILGKVQFFINQYSSKNYFKARLNANQATVSQIPRFYLELISIIGLVSFIILMVNQGKDVNQLITILGVFVAATFRMIPSLNRIISSAQSLKYSKPSVVMIYKEINSLGFLNNKKNSKEKFEFKNKIEFKNVSFGFNKNQNIIKDIDLKINKGATLGIIGESGSGKSTFVDLLIGLHKPTSGSILIDEKSEIQLKQSWRNNIGYVSQSIYLMDNSILNNIALGVSEDMIDRERINQLIKDVQLEKFVANLKLGIETKVGERGVQLSGGQRQRIGLARALYNNPDILILDEATSALDTETEIEVMTSINNLKGKKTIIIIAHRKSTLEKCDFIYEITNSRIKQVRIAFK
ncbi:ABC transporter ATP-binding protein/permease [Flavobacteriaceae bacterium]|nr:ABC transporter ATP-binding protein/permease [Flavobacteriaceae bacterium]